MFLQNKSRIEKGQLRNSVAAFEAETVETRAVERQTGSWKYFEGLTNNIDSISFIFRLKIFSFASRIYIKSKVSRKIVLNIKKKTTKTFIFFFTNAFNVIDCHCFKIQNFNFVIQWLTCYLLVKCLWADKKSRVKGQGIQRSDPWPSRSRNWYPGLCAQTEVLSFQNVAFLMGVIYNDLVWRCEHFKTFILRFW